MGADISAETVITVTGLTLGFKSVPQTYGNLSDCMKRWGQFTEEEKIAYINDRMLPASHYSKPLKYETCLSTRGTTGFISDSGYGTVENPPMAVEVNIEK